MSWWIRIQHIHSLPLAWCSTIIQPTGMTEVDFVPYLFHPVLRAQPHHPEKIPLTPACTWHLHLTACSTSSSSDLKNSPTSPQALLLLPRHSLSFLIELLTKLWKFTLFFSNPQINFLLIMNRVLTDMGNYSLSQSEPSSSMPCANSRMSLDQHISLLLPSPTHFGMAFTLLIVLFSSWIRPGPILLGRPLGSCSSGNAHIVKTLVCFLYLYGPLTSITIL